MKTAEEISNSKKKADASSYVKFDGSVLTISQRNPQLADMLVIEKYKINITAYKPKEYIYTGVTVGGITTGGVTEVGGYNYIAHSQKTDKYYLSYLDEGRIYRIQLTDVLFEEAVHSNIACFLDKSKKQIVVVTPVKLSPAGENALKFKYTKLYEYELQVSVADSMPSYEKCIAIIDWLSGKEHKNAACPTVSAMSYGCPTCGAPIEFGATKCNSCGQDIVWQ